VAAHVPLDARSVLDVGCGPLGGFVPMLSARSHDAFGIDPRAPEGDQYARTTVEDYRVGGYDAVVASTSLHHVPVLARAVRAIADLLRPGGLLLVIEWDWQRFDTRTAEWCSRRVALEQSWLTPLLQSSVPGAADWDAAVTRWAEDRGLHSGAAIARDLADHFDVAEAGDGPYFFPDLPQTSAEDEQRAIDRGEVRANCRYLTGRRRRLR
jgi:SAM-dependent methyltransferase